MNKRRAVYLVVLLTIAAAIYYAYSIYQQNRYPTVLIDEVAWTQVLYWNFKDGLYPNGWGWGNWSILDGKLRGEDSSCEIAVYFLPCAHGGNFILETKVKFLNGAGIRDVEAQLLTRDSNQINFESGMVVFAEENRVTVRHMANKIDYVYKTFDINVSVTYGEWYVMRLMVYKGRVKAFVNESKVYDSNGSLTVGEYREPHLAVKCGIALFEYFKIFAIP